MVEQQESMNHMMAGEETEQFSCLAEIVNAQAGEELCHPSVALSWANLWVSEEVSVCMAK